MNPYEVVSIPGHPNMFVRRVARDAWERAGSPGLRSAGRLYDAQKALFVGWANRLPGFSPADNPDNTSLRLAHVRFIAFDVVPPYTVTQRAAMLDAGFVAPYSYEPWHFEVPGVYNYEIVKSIPSTSSLETVLIESREVMETVVRAPNKTIVHFRNGGKMNFANDAQYSTFKTQLEVLKKNGGSNLMTLPEVKAVVNVDWPTFNMLAAYFGAPAN